MATAADGGPASPLDSSPLPPPGGSSQSQQPNLQQSPTQP
ncbi:hypothetical protein CLOM_g13372, partial [Closterium sp. NIES-68]